MSSTCDNDSTSEQLMNGQTIYREFIDTFYQAEPIPWQYLLPPMYNSEQSTKPTCIQSNLQTSPSRAVNHEPENTISTVTCRVEKQYTMPEKDLDQLSERRKHKLVKWKVRFVKHHSNNPDGSPQLFVIVDDIDPVFHVRARYIRKTISNYGPDHKRTMYVSSNNTDHLKKHLVLGMEGLNKLLEKRSEHTERVEKLIRKAVKKNT